MPKRRTTTKVLAKSVGARQTARIPRAAAGSRADAFGPPETAFGGEAAETPDVVSQGDPKKALAPRPLIDKYPIVVGAGLTFSYLAAVQRIALTGYRMQYVDLLREILERDPHLFSQMLKMVLGVANGRLQITPPKLPPDDPDIELAKEIANDVARRVDRIRGLKQSVATLVWGAFYGVSCAENHYIKDERDASWLISHLGFVHSRRLAFPDSQSWDLYIWDQGQVSGDEPFGQSPTNNNIFGLRVADWPHKFVVYAPQLSGDYPTREGFGRLIAEWALIKRAGARNALVYLEQFSKPLPELTYNTADPQDEHPGPRVAEQEDVDAAQSNAAALATGSLASFVHPDSITLDMNSPEPGNSKITFRELNEICNEEESKAIVGSTLTTTGGSKGGNRSLGETHEKAEKNVISFLADTTAEALREQLITPLTLLNHPRARHLIPCVTIHVEDEDPEKLLKLATDGAASNIPVDADEIGKLIGLPLTPKPAGVKFRVMMPLDVTKPEDLDPTITPAPPPGTKAGAAHEIEKKKAEKPPPPIGQPGGAVAAPPKEPKP